MVETYHAWKIWQICLTSNLFHLNTLTGLWVVLLNKNPERGLQTEICRRIMHTLQFSICHITQDLLTSTSASFSVYTD